MSWSSDRVRASYLGAIGENDKSFTGIKKKVDYATYNKLLRRHNKPEE